MAEILIIGFIAAFIMSGANDDSDQTATATNAPEETQESRSSTAIDDNDSRSETEEKPRTKRDCLATAAMCHFLAFASTITFFAPPWVPVILGATTFILNLILLCVPEDKVQCTIAYALLVWAVAGVQIYYVPSAIDKRCDTDTDDDTFCNHPISWAYAIFLIIIPLISGGFCLAWAEYCTEELDEDPTTEEQEEETETPSLSSSAHATVDNSSAESACDIPVATVVPISSGDSARVNNVTLAEAYCIDV